MDPEETLHNLINWPFLDEPIYRWFIFLAIIGLFLNAWKGVLRGMRIE